MKGLALIVADNALGDEKAFTPAVLNALREATASARSAGRNAPLGEEIIISLLHHGREEAEFAALFEHSGINPVGLAADIVPLIKTRSLTGAELETSFMRFSQAVSLLPPADACLVLSALLASSHLGDLTRDLVFSRLAVGAALVSEPLLIDQDDATRPPFGRLLQEQDAPVLAGRHELAERVRSRFAAGLNTLLHGYAGVGKSAIARHAAATSGRLVVELRIPALRELDPSDAAAKMARLEQWLLQHHGGLLLLDGDESPLSWLQLSEEVPIILTLLSASSEWPLDARREFARLAVSELDTAEARHALAAWASEPGRPALAPEALDEAVALATTYLREPGMMPGAAIRLIEQAHAETLDGGQISAVALEQAVARVTGLPLALVCEHERLRLNSIDQRLAKHIIGQDEAISAVSRATWRRAFSVEADTRPAGVFLFNGPTGVGKTELARALAIELFGTEDALVRFDMGEYQHDHEIAKLIGAPPGYKGHESGGQLITALQKTPRMVLLLDEIEKAHQAIYDFLLGAFDYGVITGTRGQKASLHEAIVIMTSNLGSSTVHDNRATIGFGGRSQDNETVTRLARGNKAVLNHFRAEFRNRIDEIVQFRSLSREDLDAVLQLRLDRFITSLSGMRVSFSLGPRLRSQMVDEAVESKMGARELVQRTFRSQVEDVFTEALREGMYRPAAHYEIELNVNGIATCVRREVGNA